MSVYFIVFLVVALVIGFSLTAKVLNDNFLEKPIEKTNEQTVNKILSDDAEKLMRGY